MTLTETRPRPAPGPAEPAGPGPGRHRLATDPPPRRRTVPELSALAVLLAGTGVLYLWNLSASGWANSFYAAAVQAGTQSWTAFFFGSLDAGNAITVDKPPAALWVMELSARIFGFSSWSLLVPQALMGVAAVGLLYATVRRVAGSGAGLLAGTALALTPVATLMFRFDNPDALLTLLLVAAAYATTRAWEVASRRAGTAWLVLAGVVIGFAFLTKMMQAFLILPALAAAYGLTARTGVWRRVRQIALAGAGVVVGAGWWLLAVSLWPESARPYIGGSENNSAWELALGYNGLGRIFGGEGNGGGGGGGGGFGGTAGLLRLFNSEWGTQISWLLPAALLLGAAGLWFARGHRDLRGALVLWGGWTVVTALTFSMMSGTVHPYYAVALAPGIAAVVGIGGVLAWRARATWAARAVLAASSAGTAAWAFVMLGWSDSSLTVLRWPVLVAGVVAGAALLLPPGRRLARASVGLALLAGLLAPAAYSVDTALTAHTGSTPSAGPAVAGSDSGPGGGSGGQGGPGGGTPPGGATQGGTAPSATTAASTTATATTTAATAASTGGGTDGGSSRMSGGPGGQQTNSELSALLANAAGTRWAAATVGSQSAATMELASGSSVMAIGGWSGSDASPTLEQFQAYVAAGEIRYFVAGEQQGGGPGGGSDSVGTAITEWVQAHYTATTVGGQTVYDLTAPTS